MDSRSQEQIEKIKKLSTDKSTLKSLQKATDEIDPSLFAEEVIDTNLVHNIILHAAYAKKLSFAAALLKNKKITLSERYNFFKQITDDTIASPQGKAELMEVLLSELLTEQSATAPKEFTTHLTKMREELSRRLTMFQRTLDSEELKPLKDSLKETTDFFEKIITGKNSLEQNIIAYSNTIVVAAAQPGPEVEIEKIVPAAAPATSLPVEIVVPKKDYTNLDAEKIKEIFADFNLRMQKGDPCHQELQQFYIAANNQKAYKKNAELKDAFKELNKQSADVLTNALLAMDKKVYENIDSYDLFVNTQKEPAKSVTDAIKQFNKISEYITEDVTSRSSIAETTFALEHWLRVAENCLNHPKLPDSSMAFCIAAALNHSAVSRLKASYAGLSPEAKKIFQRLDALKDFRGNYENLRKYHEQADKKNALPYFGIFLTQFNAFREGAAYTKNNNVRSYAPAYALNRKIRRNIQAIKNNPFRYDAYKNLAQQIEQTHFNEQEAYQRSLKMEPRNTTSQPSNLKLDSLYDKNTSAPSGKMFSADPPNNTETSIAILESKNEIFQLFLNLFSPNLFVTSLQPDIEKDKIEERVNDTLKAMTDDYNKGNNKNRLYALRHYGKEADLDFSAMDNASADKIRAKLNEPNFVRNTVNELRPLILREVQIQSPEILVKHNDPRNVFFLDAYARELFLNERKQYMLTNAPMDEPPLRKAMAILYLAVMDSAFFSGNDVVTNNRLELASEFIDELSQQDLVEFLKVVNADNPRHFGEKVLEVFPTELQKHLRELSFQNSVAAAKTTQNKRDTQDQRINELLTSLLAKNFSGDKSMGIKDFLREIANYGLDKESHKIDVLKASKVIEIFSELDRLKSNEEMANYLEAKLKNDPDLAKHQNPHLPDIKLTTDINAIATTKKTTLQKNIATLIKMLRSSPEAKATSTTKIVEKLTPLVIPAPPSHAPPPIPKQATVEDEPLLIPIVTPPPVIAPAPHKPVALVISPVPTQRPPAIPEPVADANSTKVIPPALLAMHEETQRTLTEIDNTVARLLSLKERHPRFFDRRLAEETRDTQAAKLNIQQP